MNLLFRISKMYTPDYVKKRELMNLFRITASAFKRIVASTTGLSFEECLAEYAHFTKSEIDKAIRSGEDLQKIQDQLYNSAYEFGKKFRRQFRISTTRDVMEASRFLYRILGIDFQGTELGTIIISKCFFSQYYSPSTCRVISSLDAGLIAGLSEGGGMIFSERITEGSKSCKAQLLSKERLQ